MLPRARRPGVHRAIPPRPSPRTRVVGAGTMRARATPSRAVLLATMACTPARVSCPPSGGSFKPLSHVGRRHFRNRSPSHGPGRACLLNSGRRARQEADTATIRSRIAVGPCAEDRCRGSERRKGEEEKQRDRARCRASKSSHYSPVLFASMRVRMSARLRRCKNVAGEDLFQSSRTYRTGCLGL